MGNIFSIRYFSYLILQLFQNQSVAPLIAAQIYRLAGTMALHSATKKHYENNARLVLLNISFDYLSEYVLVNSILMQCQS